MMSLRNRLENSDLLHRLLSAVLAVYLRLCLRTTRWQAEGLDDLIAALRQGPIILVLWHSRIMLGPAHWPSHMAPLATLRDTSPAGKLSGATQARFGMHPIAMSDRASNQTASRRVLKIIRGGTSLGLTADGPLGPARRLKPPPLDWARASGVPVFVYAYACPGWRVSTWDKMLMPRPFGRGAYVYRRWNATIPKRPDAEHLAELAAALQAQLNQATSDADALVGLPPGP